MFIKDDSLITLADVNNVCLTMSEMIKGLNIRLHSLQGDYDKVSEKHKRATAKITDMVHEMEEMERQHTKELNYYKFTQTSAGYARQLEQALESCDETATTEHSLRVEAETALSTAKEEHFAQGKMWAQHHFDIAYKNEELNAKVFDLHEEVTKLVDINSKLDVQLNDRDDRLSKLEHALLERTQDVQTAELLLKEASKHMSEYIQENNCLRSEAVLLRSKAQEEHDDWKEADDLIEEIKSKIDQYESF